MHANTPNHEQSMRLMNCGDERLSRPSLGAWLTYGLGSENENLPGFIAMCPGLPVCGCFPTGGRHFLPGVYQGTHLDTRKTKIDELIENIRSTEVSKRDQRRQLDLLSTLNRQHPRRTSRRAGAGKPASRRSRLAYRMAGRSDRRLWTSRASPAYIQAAYGGYRPRSPTADVPAGSSRRGGPHRGSVITATCRPWDSHNDPRQGSPRSRERKSTAPLAATAHRSEAGAALFERNTRHLRRRIRPHTRSGTGQWQSPAAGARS